MLPRPEAVRPPVLIFDAKALRTIGAAEAKIDTAEDDRIPETSAILPWIAERLLPLKSMFRKVLPAGGAVLVAEVPLPAAAPIVLREAKLETRLII